MSFYKGNLLTLFSIYFDLKDNHFDVNSFHNMSHGFIDTNTKQTMNVFIYRERWLHERKKDEIEVIFNEYLTKMQVIRNSDF